MSNPRQAKTTRRAAPAKIVIQERDKQILSLLVKYRFLTTSQLHRLCFGARSKALKRLRQLYDANLVNRLFRPVIVGNAEIVYTIAPKGLSLLKGYQNTGDLSENLTYGKRTQLFLEHELALVKFRLAAENSCDERGIEILFWKSTPQLRILQKGKLIVEKIKCLDGTILPLLPDAFFGIRTQKGKSFFFVEMDMGTESLKRIAAKFKAYVNYLRNGQFQNRWGYKAFRVLVITTSQKRIDNMIQFAKAHKSFSLLFWFATQEQAECSESIFAHSWLCASNESAKPLVESIEKSESDHE